MGHKSPRNLRPPGQKAPSRRDLSIGTRHADRAEVHVKRIGVWVPVLTTPARPCDRKVPETRGTAAKKFHLDEIYRSVPAMPPGTEQKARLQIWPYAFSPNNLYISELAPRAWSGMTGVVNSLKSTSPREVRRHLIEAGLGVAIG